MQIGENITQLSDDYVKLKMEQTVRQKTEAMILGTIWKNSGRNRMGPLILNESYKSQLK